ncbi:MAG TPA: hypothetical protein VIG94_02775 [Faecalibacter sp.]|uniref:hypothetical protein n=1 Tax=Faecalibacter sp. LW9 TaxID=3103144 RepID=UPI002AFE37CC|nr:hypothetical protein [Faecalibacter sp. LW9]
MKRILSIFMVALMGVFITVSCTDDDGVSYVDNDTISDVYDLKNVSFDYDQGYYLLRNFTRPLYDSDVVLVYRQTNAANSQPVWKLLPNTIYFNDGNELDYTFDFSKNDVQIYVDATFDLANSEYIKNQTFRVVVVPANYGRSATPLDYNDYNAVINYYNINDKNPSQL